MNSAESFLALALVVAVLVSLWLRGRGLWFKQPTPSEELAPPPPSTPVPPDESLAITLHRVSERLDPLAEKSAHPRDMTEWPVFQEAVDAFSRPEVSIEVLRQYIFGANWALSCAALLALKKHPDRGSQLTNLLAQLAKLRPWVVYFALQYIVDLEPRPPVGAPIAVAPKWWPDNMVIPDLFREYFAQRESKGDEPTFADYLNSPLRTPPEFIDSLLGKIDHPFAGQLLEELRRWRGGQIDRRFLASFGRFWTLSDDDRLLVEPEPWRDLLDHAERAILHKPPRSIMVSGELGVGKTSFVDLLARRLSTAGWNLFEASGVELAANQTYIGQLEGRVRQMLAELDSTKRMAWRVGDLLQIAESGTHRGQSATILDQVLPAIIAGRLVLVGEASPAGVSRLMQIRPSLRSHMEIFRLHAMNESEATSLATQVAYLIERHRSLKIEPQALTTVLHLTQQYLGSGQLPGAAIELLKRSANLIQTAKSTNLTPADVFSTLSQMTGLPISILDDKQRIELELVRRFFAERVIGQEEAVSAIVDRVAMLKAGLVDPNRPVGVFLFAGPTGTGKTELAKTLAAFLFSSPDRLVHLDMSEFQTAESTIKILGQGGYTRVADSLVEKIRKQPFSVVLLDEFEKAHANVWDLFLQIFDAGRLTDANGRTVDFRHTIVVLTSNLGATSHQSAGLGFVPSAGAYSENQVLRAVQQTFRPEFVNRLDKIIVFRPLSRELMRSILRKELKAVLERRGLRWRDWAVEWESSAIEFLLDRGFSPEMGARPLKRAIDEYLLAPLAATIVEHRFPEGDQFLFVRSNGKAIEVEFVDPDASEEEAIAVPDVESGGEVSLAAMILRPRGTARERAALDLAKSQLEAELASANWATLKQELQMKTAAGDIWTRQDRFAIFARLALMDRVSEATRTAQRLTLRLDSSGKKSDVIPRDLVSRLALQLHLIRQGVADALLDSPIDVLMSIEPILDGSTDGPSQTAWCGQISKMYKRWAERRRMQFEEVLPVRGRGPAILLVSGFGAFRTLAAEAGLHVLEETEQEGGRRAVARVRTAAGPVEETNALESYRQFADRLSRAAESSAVVRRYRGNPAPLVRDAVAGWRSGRLEAVLDGDFDLIGQL